MSYSYFSNAFLPLQGASACTWTPKDAANFQVSSAIMMRSAVFFLFAFRLAGVNFHSLLQETFLRPCAQNPLYFAELGFFVKNSASVEAHLHGVQVFV